MRTNIEIDDDLMAAAMAAGGFKTKKEAVEEGLRLLKRTYSSIDILCCECRNKFFQQSSQICRTEFSCRRFIGLVNGWIKIPDSTSMQCRNKMHFCKINKLQPAVYRFLDFVSLIG